MIIFTLPYNKFLENGKPVFENLHDGAEAAVVTLGSVKEIYEADLKHSQNQLK